jgi:DNA-binding NarL/FixJ family response regulator
MQVVQLVAEGLSDRQIASRLGISPRTVDNHLRHIFEKVGVSSRTALATWVARDQRSSGGPSGLRLAVIAGQAPLNRAAAR